LHAVVLCLLLLRLFKLFGFSSRSFLIFPHVRRAVPLLLAALLSAAAFSLVLAATDPPGPGLDPDAMQYMGAAESLAAHGRYQIPSAPWWNSDSTSALAHFPPGFPTALAIPVRLGMAPPQAARLVNALAAAVTAAVVVLLVSEAAASVLAGALAVLALFTMAAMHLVHLSVLSEPLFLACTALTLAAMTRRSLHPLLAGIPAAVGILTRYAGLSLVGATVLWVFADGRGTPRARLRHAALALLPALLLQGAWVIRTKRIGGPAQIRQFALYGDILPMLRQGGATLRDWLVPDAGIATDPLPHRGWLAGAAGLILVTLMAASVRRAWAMHLAAGASPPAAERASASRDAPWRLFAAIGLLGVCYLGMLIVSRLVADPAIPLDERLLSPFLLLATIAVAVSVSLWWRAAGRGPVHVLSRVLLAGALVAWCVGSMARTRDEVEEAFTWGSDFASDSWRRSALLEWARTNGRTQPLYSNWPSAVYFHLHRPARGLPDANEDELFAAFADSLRARGGVVLAFTVSDASVAAGDQLRRVPGLRVIANLADGMALAPLPRR
jgi:hypothetical protein